MQSRLDDVLLLLFQETATKVLPKEEPKMSLAKVSRNLIDFSVVRCLHLNEDQISSAYAKRSCYSCWKHAVSGICTIDCP